MSIFRRESEPPAEPKPAARPAKATPRPQVQEKSTASESTHIAKGSKVVGQISGNANLIIDGVVDGEIDLESRVVVGAEGRVEGKILARSVEVGGHVHGNVQGVERVEVLATGSLEGDVLSPRVVIAEGAFFKGKVEMTDKIPQRPTDSSKSRQDQPGHGSQSKSDGANHKNSKNSHKAPVHNAGVQQQAGSKNRQGARR